MTTSGTRNKNSDIKIPMTTATNPVLPPSPIPTALSTCYKV